MSLLSTHHSVDGKTKKPETPVKYAVRARGEEEASVSSQLTEVGWYRSSTEEKKNQPNTLALAWNMSG
jgi:hypothetical protein